MSMCRLPRHREMPSRVAGELSRVAESDKKPKQDPQAWIMQMRVPLLLSVSFMKWEVVSQLKQLQGLGIHMHEDLGNFHGASLKT